MNRNVTSEWIGIDRVIEFGRAGKHRKKSEIAIATCSLSFAAEEVVVALRFIRHCSVYWYDV